MDDNWKIYIQFIKKKKNNVDPNLKLLVRRDIFGNRTLEWVC